MSAFIKKRYDLPGAAAGAETVPEVRKKERPEAGKSPEGIHAIGVF